MPPKVLVVDDSSLQRTIISGALGDRFEVVGEAENGREGVELFESEQPDLVTMDIMMPEMDGVEATGRIKELTEETKVMMCTSVEQAEKMKEAVRAGADEYVTKPFDEDELVDTATMLLN
ncbi:MAG: two-component system chemotaxis response regulator CheY [Natronomonas sp.]|jgi:two-component system chemotaxis response regulator CheY|uniref:response regulator n=1 Tax=Natronomonas sp. TaxID=2184060 RepID=UPI003989D3F3